MRKKLAKFIDESVKALLNNEATNCRYILDDRLAVFVGWSAGYGEELRDDVIQDKNDPDWGINIAIKVHTSDYLWTDFDYLNYPYYEDGECWMTVVSINHDYDADNLADYMLKEYEGLKKLKIAEDGLIIGEEEKVVEISKDAIEEACKNLNFCYNYGLDDLIIKMLEGKEIDTTDEGWNIAWGCRDRLIYYDDDDIWMIMKEYQSPRDANYNDAVKCFENDLTKIVDYLIDHITE